MPRELKEEIELKHLSPYATKSRLSRGRRRRQDDCPVRTMFERDTGRIIYSMPFRRLRQKTQVFFNPRNDHICTRMEHVIYVMYLSMTIGKALNLNQDLIQAISLGHDLGHAPFGHAGEDSLNKTIKEQGGRFRFQHELHSLRTVDLLAEHKSQPGLNLSFEVRDGIASHCGESISEYKLEPWRDKTEAELILGAEEHRPPATLEGCVVRIVDRIAYVGRDIEDAYRAGLMSFSDIPLHIRAELGDSNSAIVNTLVLDLLSNSYDQDAIVLSEARGEALRELIEENYARIYKADQIIAYENMVENVIKGLFKAFLAAAQGQFSTSPEGELALENFHNFLKRHPEKDASPIRKVTDYIAGMTDHYATTTFNSIYQI
ncbi:MAG TPA: HD domain-containing protein [Clostridiaceae bacterium]|nr:HD domain-containing protein [Clostridiaceae bacterium]